MVGLGVRMYDRDKIDEALEALSLGFSSSQAAELVGASPSTVQKWARGMLPHERGARIGGGKPRGEAARMPAPRGLYDPPASGPLSGLTPDQIENLLPGAVLADLKAGGWDPASISNRSKCELGERSGRETGLPLRCVTAFLRISKSSYEYHRARLGRDRDADIREAVARLFREGRGAWGYRVVHARLARAGVRASEKRVRRVMREEGLRVVYAGRRRRRWSSYEGEPSPAPPNLVRRDFRAGAPDELWLTDITEFRLPSGRKVYLSVVLDCFDGMPVGWSAGTSPSAELANSSLLGALARRRPGARTVVHSDRGGHYRWPGWVAICERAGLVRSMSAKGCSPDNAACEGFFGRLKNEMFYHRDWTGATPEALIGYIGRYMEYYSEGRIKEPLGWLSPAEYRRKLGYRA